MNEITLPTETALNTLLTAYDIADQHILTVQDTGRPMRDETQYVGYATTVAYPTQIAQVDLTGHLRDFDTGAEDYYRGFGKAKTKEIPDNIELKKDGVVIGKVFIENNSVKFEGDLDNSAVLLFDMVRKMHSKYINQIYYALGTYTDAPNRDGLYLADSIISNLDKPFPFTETQKILV